MLPSPGPLVELRGVAHAYAEHRIIDSLSFAVPRGSIACLLGPSGCGKTTLLRCIAGFEPLAAGEILLDGELVSRPGFMQPPERRRIGMVFQDYALFPHLSVAANVAFGLSRQPRAEREQRMREMLRAVGLADSAHRYPHALSGGQQQRVALARALASRPRLLLLDEPFSSLDVELRERLAGEVRALLKAQDTTAILVTHDQQEAFALADEIGVMRDGRILQWDNAYNLYHRPADRFVADFVGLGNFVPGRVTRGGQVEVELGALQGELHFAGEALPDDGGAPVSMPVDVLLRPDDVVHDDSSPVRARVVGKAFRGAEILYTLRLSSGAQVLSLVPSHHDHALGEAIGVRLAADHVIVFPRAP
ncbi:MAG TPA: ABC transporter ATP-binding protein [Burkholderiales bacterium]|nr:ABC transporter ATP-binding protein [Burkholderiales bacterium]